MLCKLHGMHGAGADIYLLRLYIRSRHPCNGMHTHACTTHACTTHACATHACTTHACTTHACTTHACTHTHTHTHTRTHARTHARAHAHIKSRMVSHVAPPHQTRGALTFFLLRGCGGIRRSTRGGTGVVHLALRANGRVAGRRVASAGGGSGGTVGCRTCRHVLGQRGRAQRHDRREQPDQRQRCAHPPHGPACPGVSRSRRKSRQVKTKFVYTSVPRTKPRTGTTNLGQQTAQDVSEADGGATDAGPGLFAEPGRVAHSAQPPGRIARCVVVGMRRWRAASRGSHSSSASG